MSDTALELRRSAGWTATLGKVGAVLKVTLATRLAYLGEQIVRSLFLVLILYTFTQLWQATDASQNVLALTGFSIAQLIWYLAFTEAIMMSAPALGDNEVDEEVRSGDIAYRLARPFPYALHCLASWFGERLLRFAVNLTVASLVALAVVGPVRLSPTGVAAALAVALVAFVVDWIWSYSISLLSFWVERTDGLHLLYRRCLMILGGMLVPLEAYPDWLGDVARALPFQYLVYQPGRLFVSADGSGWLGVLGVLTLLAAAGLVPLAIVYRLGLRRIAAQGG